MGREFHLLPLHLLDTKRWWRIDSCHQPHCHSHDPNCHLSNLNEIYKQYSDYIAKLAVHLQTLRRKEVQVRRILFFLRISQLQKCRHRFMHHTHRKTIRSINSVKVYDFMNKMTKRERWSIYRVIGYRRRCHWSEQDLRCSQQLLLMISSV